jgi:hypothetical protein
MAHKQNLFIKKPERFQQALQEAYSWRRYVDKREDNDPDLTKADS